MITSSLFPLTRYLFIDFRSSAIRLPRDLLTQTRAQPTCSMFPLAWLKDCLNCSSVTFKHHGTRHSTSHCIADPQLVPRSNSPLSPSSHPSSPLPPPSSISQTSAPQPRHTNRRTSQNLAPHILFFIPSPPRDVFRRVFSS